MAKESCDAFIEDFCFSCSWVPHEFAEPPFSCDKCLRTVLCRVGVRTLIETGSQAEPRIACVFCGQEIGLRPDQVPYDEKRLVRIFKGALDEILAHAREFIAPHNRKEVIGLLIGLEESEEQLLISRAVKVTEGVHASVSFEENHFNVYETLELDEEGGEFVVGWWHSHPGFGLFLSGTDIENHAKSFQQRYSRAVALVIEPVICAREFKEQGLAIFTLKDAKNWKESGYVRIPFEIVQN